VTSSHTESTSVNRARELLANAQQALWGAMYYVRTDEIGFSETELKRAIERIEILQAKLREAQSDEQTTDAKGSPSEQ